MKIGIITFHRAYNCGAMLQAWALKTVLERMGHAVEFPACNNVGETRRWLYDLINRQKKGIKAVRSFIGRFAINAFSIPSEDILRWRYKRFRKSYLPERVCKPSDFDRYYDVVIVGSDQVWSVKHTGSDAPIFFAENTSDSVSKIAYAASYGDKPLEDSDISRVVSSLGRFTAVSVREPLARRQLSNFSTKQIDVVLDPTLLLEDSDYGAITARFKSCKRPYLFMYTLSTAPFFINTAKSLSERLGVECVIAPCYQYSRLGAPKGLTYGISPDRLVAYVRDAKYVLAGSFHGTAMAVIFKKPFLSLRTQVDEYESRPAALLNKIGCEDRLVNPTVDIDQMEALLKYNVSPIAFDLLSVEREHSLNWLKNEIERRN